MDIFLAQESQQVLKDDLEHLPEYEDNKVRVRNYQLQLPIALTKLISYINSLYNTDADNKDQIVEFYKNIYIENDNLITSLKVLREYRIPTDLLLDHKVPKHLMTLIQMPNPTPVTNQVFLIFTEFFFCDDRLSNELFELKFPDFVMSCIKSENTHISTYRYLAASINEITISNDDFLQTVVEEDLIELFSNWKYLISEQISKQDPEKVKEFNIAVDQEPFMAVFEPGFLNDVDMVAMNIATSGIITNLFKRREALAYDDNLIPTLRGYLQVPIPRVITNILRAIRYNVSISPDRRCHYFTQHYDNEIIDFIINQKEYSNFDINIEAFLAICKLCEGDSALCEKYFTEDYFSAIPPLLTGSNRDIDVFLYNLSIIIKESDIVIQNFITSKLFETVLQLFSQEAFVIRVDSLMILTSILMSSQNEIIIETMLQTKMLDAFEIMFDVDDSSACEYFLLAIKNLLRCAQRYNKSEWINLVDERKFIRELVHEFTDNEDSRISDLAFELQDLFEEIYGEVDSD